MGSRPDTQLVNRSLQCPGKRPRSQRYAYRKTNLNPTVENQAPMESPRPPSPRSPPPGPPFTSPHRLGPCLGLANRSPISGSQAKEGSSTTAVKLNPGILGIPTLPTLIYICLLTTRGLKIILTCPSYERT